MKIGIKVEGISKVKKAIQELLKYVDTSAGVSGESVVVGYTANYALFVHENLEARHKPGKQAEFLSSPAKTLNNTGQLKETIIRAFKEKENLQEALFIGGLLIQRESQKIVPVDTGNLKGSAFTRKE